MLFVSIVRVSGTELYASSSNFSEVTVSCCYFRLVACYSMRVDSRAFRLPRLQEIGPEDWFGCRRGRDWGRFGRFPCRVNTPSALHGVFSSNAALKYVWQPLFHTITRVFPG